MATVTSDVHEPDSPLIGRGRELAAVRELVYGANESGAATVLLGHAGGGKTRLVGEAKAKHTAGAAK